jgi:hypothetical protein
MNATQTKNPLSHTRPEEARPDVAPLEEPRPEEPCPGEPRAEEFRETTGPVKSAGSAARPAAGSARLRDADGMAVASFILGLVGLLAFNLVLGPCSLVLGGLALLRGTGRRGRAVLGLGLGAADLIVLAAVSSADQSFSWSLS